jgi:hypothetical protein
MGELFRLRMSARSFRTVNGAIFTDCSFLAESVGSFEVSIQRNPMSKFIDLSGQTFDCLKVIKRGYNTRKGAAQFWCLCSCGIGELKTSRGLLKKDSKRCLFCNGKEHSIRTKTRSTRHGHCTHTNQSREYKSWASMKKRCLNPNDSKFDDYGGRGITICESWLKFENFFADMGNRPAGLTLDRIDNDGNYEPGNCKWSTWSEQQKNKRAAKL